MKRFLMKNPGNEAWIKSQEKVHEATLVSQARSKLLRNSMYPELSVVHAQIATHSPMMADLSEQCWWKGVFTRVLKELLQLERFTATMMGKQKITTYKTRTWRSKSYGLFFFSSSSRQRRCCVRIWVLRVNNPVRYSSTSSRHATCNGTTVGLPW